MLTRERERERYAPKETSLNNKADEMTGTRLKLLTAQNNNNKTNHKAIKRNNMQRPMCPGHVVSSQLIKISFEY